ncbi:Exodeoxyribonuclease VII large subunit [Streptococcus sp. ZB199]|nr:Exodeoxyribonuclease VII large subunit [Streptococcus sp. ZB199]
MAIQFEQLKKKLTEEGLFQDRWKQALPQFSRKIGVITSQSGAVIRDIITTVSRRFPGVEIVLYPTKVQGKAHLVRWLLIFKGLTNGMIWMS